MKDKRTPARIPAHVTPMTHTDTEPTDLGVGPGVEVLGACATARFADGAVRFTLVEAAHGVARPLADQHVLEGEGQQSAAELRVLLLEHRHVGLRCIASIHRSIDRRDSGGRGWKDRKKEQGRDD